MQSKIIKAQPGLETTLGIRTFIAFALFGEALLSLFSLIFFPWPVLGHTVYGWVSLLAHLIFMALPVLLAKMIFYRRFTFVSYRYACNALGYSVPFLYLSFMFSEIAARFIASQSGGKLYLPLGGWPYLALTLLATVLAAASWWALSRKRIFSPEFLGAMPSDKKAFNDVYRQSELEELYVGKKTIFAVSFKKGDHYGRQLYFRWIDPLLWAIIIVLFINHFFFQLYLIPSESMVPTFFVRDRVIAGKSFDGPTFPLSAHHLFRLHHPRVGSVVDFLNPDIETPTSSVRYNSISSRIFQPFLYTITFTLVDIDKKPDGTPKERYLVKRVIAGPGEKLAVVNGLVFKENNKTKKWAPQLPQYGSSRLYGSTYRKLREPRITPSLAAKLDSAQHLVSLTSAGQVQKQLSAAALLYEQALQKAGGRASVIRALSYYLPDGKVPPFKTSGYNQAVDAAENLSKNYLDIMRVNKTKTPADIVISVRSAFPKNLESYRLTAAYLLLTSLQRQLKASSAPIQTSLSSASDPFSSFMIRFNGLYKSEQLRYFASVLPAIMSESLLKNKKTAAISDNLYNLFLFVRGVPPMGEELFNLSNYPAFPKGSNQFIAPKHYFLMGDNRLNSLDSRFGFREMNYSLFPLDKGDKGAFATKVHVSWAGKSVNERFIEGRLAMVLFPFSRFKLLR